MSPGELDGVSWLIYVPQVWMERDGRPVRHGEISRVKVSCSRSKG